MFKWRRRKRMVLAQAVQVAPYGIAQAPLKVLRAGTRRSAIPPSELVQLCDDHFTIT